MESCRFRATRCHPRGRCRSRESGEASGSDAVHSDEQRTPAENWPEFRGPSGDGQTPSRDLPLNWSETENIAWKTPIHDRGWSSPVIWQNQVWVTTATEDGRRLFAVWRSIARTGAFCTMPRVFDVERRSTLRSSTVTRHRLRPSNPGGSTSTTGPTARRASTPDPAASCGRGGI